MRINTDPTKRLDLACPLPSNRRNQNDRCQLGHLQAGTLSCRHMLAGPFVLWRWYGPENTYPACR